MIREEGAKGREGHLFGPRTVREIASKYGRHNVPQRAPTRGAPTGDRILAGGCDWYAEGHGSMGKARLLRLGDLRMGAEGHPQGAPLDWATCEWEQKGTHKGRPSGDRILAGGCDWYAEGHVHETRLLTTCEWEQKGTHKGRPYPLEFKWGQPREDLQFAGRLSELPRGVPACGKPSRTRP